MKFFASIFALIVLTACSSPFDACVENGENYSEDNSGYYACLDFHEENCYFVEESVDHTRPVGYKGDWPVTYSGEIYDSEGNFIDDTWDSENDRFTIRDEDQNFVLFKSKCRSVTGEYFSDKTAK